MPRVLKTSIGCALIACCAGPVDPSATHQWEHLGLAGDTVFVLVHEHGFLYAGTGNGLYRLHLHQGDTLWTAFGLQGRRVHAFLPLGGDSFLAAIGISWVDADTISLFRTTDGGANWQPFQNSFGSGEGGKQVWDIDRLDDGSLLAIRSSNAMSKSSDNGGTWREVWRHEYGSAVHGFIHIDSNWPTRVWAGGEDAIFQPFIVFSGDRGETWTLVRLNVGGDNSHYSVAHHPSDPKRVYSGMEGRIVRTTDGGANWMTVYAPPMYPYFFGVAVSSLKPDRVFAGGSWRRGSQQLTIFISEDGGDSWTAHVAPGDDGGVRQLLLLPTAHGETVYVGTERGVFSYVH